MAFFNLLNKEISKKFDEIEKKISASFKIVREEFEDHLDAINENTNEIQSHIDYIEEIDSKIKKLNEKIEELQMMVNQIANNSHFCLTKNEQMIFLVLYSIEETPLSYSDIARKLNMTELSVKAHIYSLINKGIPIVSRIINGMPYFKLEKQFKERQEKEHLVKISSSILEQLKPMMLNSHF